MRPVFVEGDQCGGRLEPVLVRLVREPGQILAAEAVLKNKPLPGDGADHAQGQSGEKFKHRAQDVPR